MCNIEVAKLDGKAVALLLATGRGWQVLEDDHPEIVLLALYAIKLTACLDQGHRCGFESLALKDLAILATIFQHDLYKLNPAPGTKNLVCDLIFDIARLGLQIYSDLVLFPAAETYHAKHRLCQELLATTRMFFETGAPRFDETKMLVLWALVMGAIGSDTAYRRDWYLRRIIGLVIQLDHDWESFKASMEYFLWWDYIFEARVSDIWKEAWKLIGKGQATASTRNSDSHNWSQVVGGKAKWLPVMLTD